MSAEATRLDKRRKQRPLGWVAPGPSPRGDGGDPTLVPSEDEDLSFLTGDFRIFQKKRGHRWSLDDFLTALIAIREGKHLDVTRTADLGCGIGSVLMMLAWAFPQAECTGIEAQELSLGLARRSLRFNGVEDRVRLLHGDLRNEAPTLSARSFDLVTGTPPYIPFGSGLVSDRSQRSPCFFEERGGLEDYCLAAAELLRDDGRFVVCAGVHPPDRGPLAAEAAGLGVERQIDVIPREGKRVLFRVFVMSRRAAGQSAPLLESFIVRDASGDNSTEMLEARRELGIPEMERPTTERSQHSEVSNRAR